MKNFAFTAIVFFAFIALIGFVALIEVGVFLLIPTPYRLYATYCEFKKLEAQ